MIWLHPQRPSYTERRKTIVRRGKLLTLCLLGGGNWSQIRRQQKSRDSSNILPLQRRFFSSDKNTEVQYFKQETKNVSRTFALYISTVHTVDVNNAILRYWCLVWGGGVAPSGGTLILMLLCLSRQCCRIYSSLIWHPWSMPQYVIMHTYKQCCQLSFRIRSCPDPYPE